MRGWVSYLIAIVVLAVVAYIATAFFPGTIGSIIALLCGLGALICVILLLVDLIKGPRGTTRA